MEAKDNSGILFKNDRKEKENHPDYKGSALIDGVEYWLASWIKEGKKGKFLSLALQKKEDKPAKPTAKNTEPIDEDIPF